VYLTVVLRVNSGTTITILRMARQADPVRVIGQPGLRPPPGAQRESPVRYFGRRGVRQRRGEAHQRRRRRAIAQSVECFDLDPKTDPNSDFGDFLRLKSERRK
jgi:hypothetical protein